MNCALVVAAAMLDHLHEPEIRLGIETVRRALNFTVSTDLGVCSAKSRAPGRSLKRASGRGKDREALAELEALLEERDGRDTR